MGVLDQVTQLKNQGMSDTQITENLQQQGISPKEITDAINQSQIKNAVSAENPAGTPPGPPEAAAPVATAGAETYTPQTQEVGAGYPSPTATGQEYYSEAGYGAYPAAAATDSDTMIEIANQVFSEKIKKIEKTIDELNEFKTMASVKIDNIDERLKKIEKIIDTIQIKILEKVGSYGKELQTTKKEMSMMQDSFRKLSGAKHTKPKIKPKTTKKKKTFRKKK